jgi:hypothetical protein
MARDGNGNYTKAEADFVGGSVINATSMNNNFDDVAVALTNSIAKNGETKITGDIDFNNNKAVNVKDATAGGDATNLKVIQNRVGVHGISAGTDTITLTLSPSISDYVAGQEFTFKAGGTNTGAATLNINTKGAKDVLTQQGLALTAGSIVADKFYKVRYDGTSFILLDDIPMNVLTEKTTLVDNDKGVIEDSEALNAKKSFSLLAVWTYIKAKLTADPVAGTIINTKIVTVTSNVTTTDSTNGATLIETTYTPLFTDSKIMVEISGYSLRALFDYGATEVDGDVDSYGFIYNGATVIGSISDSGQKSRTTSNGILSIYSPLRGVGIIEGAGSLSELTITSKIFPLTNGHSCQAIADATYPIIMKIYEVVQ